MRISIWPLYEPVVTSYGDRKKALLERWKDNDRPKSDTLSLVYDLQYPAAAPLTFITITAEEYCREVEWVTPSMIRQDFQSFSTVDTPTYAIAQQY